MRTSFLLRCLALLLALAVVDGRLSGSQFGITKVRQALYLNADTDPEILFYEVPIATAQATPEVLYLAIARPNLLPTDPGRTAEDANIVSRYGLKIEPEVKQEKVGKDKEEIEHLIVTIDASAAKVPAEYPFSLEQVIEAAQLCIKLTYGIKPSDAGKLTIKVVRAKK